MADLCQNGGVCTSRGRVECTASDACHVAGTCDPATGLCSNPALPEQGPCDDGNPTLTDVCQEGTCRGLYHATPVEVDDGVRAVPQRRSHHRHLERRPGSTWSAVLRGLVSQLRRRPRWRRRMCLDDAVTGAS